MNDAYPPTPYPPTPQATHSGTGTPHTAYTGAALDHAVGFFLAFAALGALALVIAKKRWDLFR